MSNTTRRAMETFFFDNEVARPQELCAVSIREFLAVTRRIFARYGVINSLSVSCGRPTVEAITIRDVTVGGLRTSRFRIVS